MSSYVCGFAFYDYISERSWPHIEVVLIKKQRPPEQKGKLNGVGGKMELSETSLEAMRREFLEEAGQDVPDWQHIATIFSTEDKTVMFFAAQLNGQQFENIKLLSDSYSDAHTEELFVCNVLNITCMAKHVLPDVSMIIALALNEQIAKPVILHSKQVDA